jgi:hypothetical protein
MVYCEDPFGNGCNSRSAITQLAHTGLLAQLECGTR